MNADLAQDSIQQALNGNWKNAIKLNKLILKDNSHDIDALNRLARAYSEIGNLTLALKTAKKVLSLDPFNTIALKALEKWKMIKKGDIYCSDSVKNQTFLEEPGKTKIVNLINTCDKCTLAYLDSGDEVKINAHGHKITINTKDGKYLGRIPDDISARLKTLIKHGYCYNICIKSINVNEVKVFIREYLRPEKYSDIPSFSSEKFEYISFTSSDLINKKAKISNNPLPNIEKINVEDVIE